MPPQQERPQVFAPLSTRFAFGSEPIAEGDRAALRSAMFEVEERTNGAERTLKLVYPQDADIEAGRISILSLVGAGLLGLKPGQSILWPDRTGKQRALRIIEVVQE